MKEVMKKTLALLMDIDDCESEEKQIEAIEEFAKQTMALTAKINWEYFVMLKEQGFTEEQAMQMVLAGQKND
jgi:hypothetical protein